MLTCISGLQKGQAKSNQLMKQKREKEGLKVKVQMVKEKRGYNKVEQ